ncbi:MAG TPA: hypothetical protein VMM38_08495 [Aridibacter sp.]|nr:hypothetical protein [Aridibacter sp.]
MTKHIIGLIIFSFIVGTSAFVAGFFYGSPDTAVESVYERYSETRKKKKKRKKRCRPHRFHDHSTASATIKSAVYDTHTGRLKTTFEFSEGTPEEFLLELQFFVLDEDGQQYIRTNTVRGSSWTLNYENSFDWILRFEQVEDLYVKAIILSKDEGWTSPPDAYGTGLVPLVVRNGEVPVSRGTGKGTGTGYGTGF